MKKVHKLILVVVFGLIILISGIVGVSKTRVRSQHQDQSRVQPFLKKYKIATIEKDQNDDEKYRITFEKAITVPRAEKRPKMNFELSYTENDKGQGSFDFTDQDSDDLFVARFGANFSKHYLSFNYSNNDDDFSKAAAAEFSSSYRLNSGRNFLGKAHTSYTIGNHPLETKVDLKKDQLAYDSAIRWIFKHELSPRTANALQNYFRKNASTLYKKQEKALAARARSQRKTNKSLKQRFLQATFKPRYTDQQWQMYIQKRAVFLNLSVAKITKATLTDDEAVKYDAKMAMGVMYNNEGGILNSVGYPTEQHYFLTTKNGSKYLILLPLRLYNQKTLKKWHYFKKMPTFYWLGAPTAYPKYSEMVLSNETPSAEVVSNNITICAQDSE
ncbi:hypothetical protein GA840_02900 [Pediococcus ethanolidurans]|uniref:hypothetical protein n=1 Tax=Pediococcus ethanolidurans TaxID=319653 RepID=UPI002955DDB4|nr:hypothetical protein [Pediococcus ethanolidurans]MDV7718798.1 hypothetical protein [Pediococcus ethanolidurans]